MLILLHYVGSRMSFATAAMLPLQGLQGFLFGTGYGAGVRFGYEDVYPYLKKNASGIINMLNTPFASSGFKLASGVTEHQGLGLQDAEASIGGAVNLQPAEDTAINLNPDGSQQAPVVSSLPTNSWNGVRGAHPPVGQIVDVAYSPEAGKPSGSYARRGYRYKWDGSKWVTVGVLAGYKPLNLTNFST